jgi:hypothetical protein
VKVQRTWFTQKGVESLCFFRTPDTVVIGLQAKAASAVVVLDARTGDERHRVAVPWVGAVATAGGKVYASVGADEVLAWDDPECRTPPHRAAVEGSGRHFATSPDGQLFWIDSQGALWVGGRLANQVRAAGTSAVGGRGLRGDRAPGRQDQGVGRAPTPASARGPWCPAGAGSSWPTPTGGCSRGRRTAPWRAGTPP